MGNVLLMGLMAGLGTALGAVLLFMKKRWTNGSLAVFLGLAAGVMLSVVVLDMMPSALICDSQAALTGLIIGFLLLAILNQAIFSRMNRENTLIGLGYLIMLGIALHDLPEGMAIALGSEMKARTGVIIALAIGIHNVPEGMAIAAPLLMGGLKKAEVLLQILLLGLITPAGTILGFVAVGIIPGLLPWLMGFASGIMMYLVAFQLWPQAGEKDRRSRWRGLIIGILIIALATFL